MIMADVTETDYTTIPPTITERAFTAEELAQREADAAAVAAAEAEAVERAAARRALLERLGISEDEAVLLREAGV